MASHRRRLTFGAGQLAPTSSGVAKSKQPSRPLPEWARRLQEQYEQSKRQYLNSREQSGPDEDTEMIDTVQVQVNRLDLEMQRLVEACNNEKEAIEEEFEDVRLGCQLFSQQVETEKALGRQILEGHEEQIQVLNAVLKETRTGMNNLQQQNDWVVKEATEEFGVLRGRVEWCESQLKALMVKFAAWGLTVKTQQEKITRIEKVIEEQVPSWQDFELLEAKFGQLKKEHTGLTSAFEKAKVSGSTPVHPDRREQIAQWQQRTEERNRSVSPVDDSDVAEVFGIRGGSGTDIGLGEVPLPEITAVAGGSGERPPPEGTDPPPPPPPGSSHASRRGSQRGRRGDAQHPEKQRDSRLKLSDPAKYKGKAFEDFDVWWMSMEAFIGDQPHLFTRPGLKIQYVRGRLEEHALAWHMQWEAEAQAGRHERSWSVYRAAIYARFHNKHQQETAYKAITELKYGGNVQDMITQFDTLNAKAKIVGVAYRTMLMSKLPPQVFKQLSLINPADKTDDELREIIINAGKNAEVWQATERNFGFMGKSRSTDESTEIGARSKSPGVLVPDSRDKDNVLSKKALSNEQESIGVHPNRTHL